MEIQPMEIESNQHSKVADRKSSFVNFSYLIKTYDTRFLVVNGLQYFNAGLHLAFNIAY
jgi:hypothetical protein